MSMWSSVERTRRGSGETEADVPIDHGGTAHAVVRTHWRVAQRPSVWQRLRRQGIKSVLAHVLNLRVILSVVFGLGLLAAVLALGNPARAWQLVMQTGWEMAVGVALLTIPYLAARFLVWRRLLAQEGVELTWRPIVAAFAAGELCKSLPGGVYIEDYLLGRCGVAISTSIIATTAVSALETLVAVPVVLGFGVPGWGWLLPTVAGVLAAYVVVLAALWWVANPGGEDVRVRLPGPLMTVVRGARGFLATTRPLLALRTLRDNLVPVVLSLSIVAVDVWLLGRAVGIPNFSFREAAVVYGFSTLILVLTPVPTDLGTTEASGAGALLAFGAARPQAVATLLLLRVLLTGATMLITGPLLLVMSRQLTPPPSNPERPSPSVRQ
jgi:uncharacterized membrane protein YbhN (UPF0104 family)